MAEFRSREIVEAEQVVAGPVDPRDALQLTEIVNVGDWIIRDSDGAILAVLSDEEFKIHYELVGERSVPGTKGTVMITAERLRQIDEEGWTAEHDDEHALGEMAKAAACYALNAAGVPLPEESWLSGLWPGSWDLSWWKPKNPIRDLVRAGALIAAEIDRRRRAGES